MTTTKLQKGTKNGTIPASVTPDGALVIGDLVLRPDDFGPLKRKRALYALIASVRQAKPSKDVTGEGAED